MKRRSLLATVPLLTGMSLLKSVNAASPTPPRNGSGKGVISVQCWSFKKFTAVEAMAKSAEAGAEAVELYPGQVLSPEHPEQKVGPDLSDEGMQILQDHAAKNKITLMNFGVTAIPRDISQARKYFDFAKKLNLYGITTESIDAIETLESLAKEYDLRVSFHNHPKPSALWHPDTVLKVIENRDQRLGFCADLGHWASSGLNPADVVQRIAPRIRSFHFKDRTSIENATPDLPLGTGNLKLETILHQAQSHGFNGNISIEYEVNWDNNLVEIAQCVGYLRAIRGSV